MIDNRPSLEHLKKRAKKLFKDFKAKEPNAVALVRRWRREPETATLMSVQHCLACELGFKSWDELRKVAKP